MIKYLNFQTDYDRLTIINDLHNDNISSLSFLLPDKIAEICFSKSEWDDYNVWFVVMNQDLDSQSYEYVFSEKELTDKVLFTTIPNKLKEHLHRIKDKFDSTIELL